MNKFVFLIPLAFAATSAFSADASLLLKCSQEAGSLRGQERKDAMLACLSPKETMHKNLIPAGVSFRPDAELQKRDDDVLSERGVVKGVDYKIFLADGSGSFSGEAGQHLIDDLTKLTADNHWSVACDRDAMTDRITCSLRRGDFAVYVGPTGKPSVSVGVENFPGKPISVRLGNEKPISSNARNGNFDLSSSQKIVSNLSKYESFKTRFMKWPYENWIDQELSSFGFEAAFEYVKWAAQKSNQKKN